ncbi:MAG: tetratricopeptide repeat protein [Candidatus Obscuribacterales bacterium]|jgi:tetratricopeptide (TPR) repeat protein
MFIKKKSDAHKAGKGNGQKPGADNPVGGPAGNPPSSSGAVEGGPQAAPDTNMTASGMPPSGAEPGRSHNNLKSSFSSMPAAGSEAEQAAQAASGKSSSKISIVFDMVLPVVVATVCCGAFLQTGKFAKDRTGIYGLTAEQEDLVVKDKTIAAETVITEINKLEPLKLLSHGEVGPAIEAAKALIAKKPNDTRALMAAGMVLVEAGNKADKELGIGYCNKAFEQAKYSAYIRLLYGRQLAIMHRDEDAIAVYEKIIQLFPSTWSTPHKELAGLYMRTNSSALAVKELTALLKSDNSDPGVQRELGLALAQDGKQQEGFEEFQKGFTREKDLLGYPYAVKDIVESHAGIVSSAVKDTEKRYQKNPEDVKTLLTLARLYIASNRFKEARDIATQAIKLREVDPEVHEVMSEIMCNQNQSQSGYDEFRAAASYIHMKQ